MTSQTQEKPHQERIAGLSELAAECHELAVKRGKYRGWTTKSGFIQIADEAHEWWREADKGDQDREAEEGGDALATLLSILHHRGIDVEAALLAAIQRNRARVPREYGGEREP